MLFAMIRTRMARQGIGYDSMVERRWIEYVVLILILIQPQFVSVIVMVRPDPHLGVLVEPKKVGHQDGAFSLFPSRQSYDGSSMISHTRYGVVLFLSSPANSPQSMAYDDRCRIAKSTPFPNRVLGHLGALAGCICSKRLEYSTSSGTPKGSDYAQTNSPSSMSPSLTLPA